MTKQIERLQGMAKEYTGTFTLGATTPSFDLETPIDQTYPVDHITDPLILETTRKFLGEITQIPPIYSAVKKDGERLYNLARKGEQTEIPSRKVHIYEFDITGITMPHVNFRVKCSKGTYIRSLADDFGKALQSGAHLSALRRTKIGAYNVNKAITPEIFEKELKNSLPQSN